MSKIITVANQKGGVGKTTTIALAATALSQEPFNLRVKVVDIDRQKSLVRARGYDLEEFEGVLPYDVLDYNIATLLDKVAGLDRESDIVFIDTGGKLDTNLPEELQEISKVLLLSDVLLIPFTPGNYSLDASIDFLRFALKVRESRERDERRLLVYGFLNMYQERRRNDRFLKGELEEIRRAVGVPFMSNRLGYYTLYADATTTYSLYEPESGSNDVVNFSLWLDELVKILSDE